MMRVDMDTGDEFCLMKSIRKCYIGFSASRLAFFCIKGVSFFFLSL